ncbi:MAG: thiamine phosphate synthase, partial [Nocardioidaceae bacterium]
MKIDLSLYLVTEEGTDRSTVLGTVRGAVAGGVTAVQLRDRTLTDLELYRTAVDLKELLAGTGIPLVVNDRFDVALAAGAAGVHLGQHDLPPHRVRQIAGPDVVVGWTAGSAGEVAAANALPPGTVDYLGLSPVFATGSKSDAGAPLGVEGIRQLRAAAALPCVAIGGITVANASDV